MTLSTTYFLAAAHAAAVTFQPRSEEKSQGVRQSCYISELLHQTIAMHPHLFGRQKLSFETLRAGAPFEFSSDL